MAEWHRDEQGLALRLQMDEREHLLRAEFVRGPMGYRLRQGGRKQAVAKAVGLKKGQPAPVVFDATAGLGRDAFVLACLGCSVVAWERSAQIFRLLEDGLQRALLDAVTAERLGQRLQLQHGDAALELQRIADLPAPQRPDVVYLDPMHPDRNSSATVRKEMRLFRELVGEDLDAEALFEAARAAAGRRVVVKRPRRGEPLAPGFDHQFVGNSTRFDLYLTPAASESA